jgi:hypothetical protein
MDSKYPSDIPESDAAKVARLRGQIQSIRTTITALENDILYKHAEIQGLTAQHACLVSKCMLLIDQLSALESEPEQETHGNPAHDD